MVVLPGPSERRHRACPPRAEWAWNSVRHTRWNIYVDGYHEETNAVFEFYGYYYYGCPSCFKKYSDVKRNCHQHRTVNEVYEATLKKSRYATSSRLYSGRRMGMFLQRRKKRQTPHYQPFWTSLSWFLPSIPGKHFMEVEPMLLPCIVK